MNDKQTDIYDIDIKKVNPDLFVREIRERHVHVYTTLLICENHLNIMKLCINLANRVLFSIFPRVFFASIYNNVQLFNFWLWSGTHTVTQLALHMAMLVYFLLTGCHVNSHNILCFLVCNDNPMIYRNVYENMGSGMFHFNRGFQVHAA